MGWTSIRKETDESAKEILDNVYAGIIRNEAGEPIIEHKILKSAIVNFREYYCALAIVDIKTGLTKVVAGIAKIEYNHSLYEYYNFSYKDMDETYGPYLYNCPESILKLLTPTDNEYAQKWREKAQNIINQRKMLSMLKSGAKIFFRWNDKSPEIALIKRGTIWTDGIYKYPAKVLLNRFQPA